MNKFEIKIDFSKWRIARSAWIVVTAFNRGAIIGTAQMSWSDAHPYIQWVCVKRQFRRRGAGRRIIEACLKYCRAHRKAAATLTVNKKNRPAISLYRKCGFRSTNEDNEQFWMSIPLNQ